MQQIFRAFYWGLLISFLGSLPMGTLNVTAMQIAIQETIAFALMFSCGVLLVEMIYVRLSLIAVDWLRKQIKLMKIMQWVTFAIILALAFGSFWAALHPNPEAKNLVLQNNLHRFFLGMLMSAVNPVQIPFWFGWSAMLYTKGILVPKVKVFNGYIVGIGLGTLTSHCIFIFGGKAVADSIKNSEHYINWIVGGFFTIAALIQLYKLLSGKNAVQKFDQEVN